MPIQSCSNNGKPGYKWGSEGMCYTYIDGDASSMKQSKKKAQMQGIAARLNGYKEKANEVTTSSMGSGIKNPQQGYKPKKKKKKPENIFKDIEKSLTQWFEENWVDISRPKAGGGFAPCGRADASSGKYPKCVPASRAARMAPEQIRSAVNRKQRAESTETREGKKPINVSTDVEKASVNVPTNPALYARVKAAAKAKFDVYPSAYANAWLVREYKKRGGGYRVVSKSDEITNKIAEDLAEEEAMLADALIVIARMHGKFNEDETGIWAGYESAAENEVKDIGVKCANCVLYEGSGVCMIIAQEVEDEGMCRFAVIPDGVVIPEEEDDMEYDMESESEYNEEMINGYPAATQDIELNMQNRQNCIDKAAYGPMNPLIENTEFWQNKADIFHTTIEEAKTAKCGNCAAFIQTSAMREAMANGLGGEDITYTIIDLANLGYCEIFDFKCAGDRTCNAWVVGGPVNDENADMNKSMVSVRKIQYRDPLK